MLQRRNDLKLECVSIMLISNIDFLRIHCFSVLKFYNLLKKINGKGRHNEIMNVWDNDFYI